tara:strand:- start:239 stop:640 length:402 start_codon:yes stop_codon:yes gene_type:complete
MNIDQKKLITQKELATRWRVSERTLEQKRSRKKGLNFYKPGGKVLYDLNDAITYENDHYVMIHGLDMNTEKNREFFTQEELAARWRQSERTLENNRHRETGPNYFKLTGKVLYEKSDIIKWESKSYTKLPVMD